MYLSDFFFYKHYRNYKKLNSVLLKKKLKKPMKER